MDISAMNSSMTHNVNDAGTGQAGSLSALLERLASQDGRVQELQTRLTAARAVGPENGGEGEGAKAAFIESVLRGAGITDIVHVDAPDDRVPGGLRPNLIATLPGNSARALWLFAHMDVVPAGDPGLWRTDPWQVVRDGDLLTGRGVEDNQQSLVSMLLLAEGLKALDITPELTLRLVFMSDEECGNSRGLDHVLQSRPDLFPAGDLYIVPDGGSPSGSDILVAEKSLYWLKFTVTGSQCHASTPDKGRNALVAASAAILALDGLNREFPLQDGLFEPARSTFTPTRHELNVDGVNIMPGRDVFWLDSRLVPGVEPEAVRDRAAALASAAAAEHGCTVEVEEAMLQRASKTDPQAPVVLALSRALAEEGVTPRLIGIGGGTVAALLRRAGLPACVWSTIQECCHEPNERSSISATLRDARVFARLLAEVRQ
ncbi:MAG: M20 family metallo-hydrolase [Desulfovibrionaceae bacterium]|nr:M20 family metallo-hydrolase [Desulfovibrionaceae bacterium]